MIGTSSTDGASSESLEISPSSIGVFSVWLYCVTGWGRDVPGWSSGVRCMDPPLKFCGECAVNCQSVAYSSDCCWQCGRFRISQAGVSILRIISKSLSSISLFLHEGISVHGIFSTCRLKVGIFLASQFFANAQSNQLSPGSYLFSPDCRLFWRPLF